MNSFRTFFKSAIIISFIFACHVVATFAATVPGPKVSELAIGGGGNKHNLSTNAWPAGTTTYNTANFLATSNPNTYKADSGGTNPRRFQICVFCHTPHSANVEGGAPLWNRRFSNETFTRYSSGTLEIRITSATRTAAGYDTSWKPDGSSKLCLSCHDGVATGSIDSLPHGLGDLLNGGTIAMTYNVIGDSGNNIASFNPSNNKMKTGHHPVSFTYNATVQVAINDSPKSSWKFPPTETAVKLDKNGKMQCTTCHNAHQNLSSDTECHGGTCDSTFTRKKAPFWVLGGEATADDDRDRVCRACHAIDADSGFAAPWPIP